ncbi:MAG: ribosome maturation factor RimP [Clostridium perfringens]|nr:ribosome maturation factor RimP [Clostridium perfringens]
MIKEQFLLDLEEMFLPIVNDLNYELYHVEYVKENNQYYLRLYIDKENGRISLSDCEAVSRRVSELLDEKDPIKDPYYLEVSSPGLNRKLYKDEHFNKFLDNEMKIIFTKAIDGNKNVQGVLKEVKEDVIVLEVEGNEINVPKDKIKSANLEGEI